MPRRESLHRDAIPRSGPPLGGIGTGSIEVRKDGVFRNWTIFNNRPLFSAPPPEDREEDRLFFFVRWREDGGRPQFRLLQIRSDASDVAGIILQPYTFRWLRSIERTEFEAAWPFATLRFEDGAMPFELRLDAFSPFVPHQAEDSSLPGVYFDFTARPKKGAKKVEVLLVANLKHLAGYGSADRRFEGGPVEGKGWRGFEFHAGGLDEKETTRGQLCLAGVGRHKLSHHLGWSHQHVFHEPLMWEADLRGTVDIDGQNGEGPGGKRVAKNDCFGSLARRFTLGGAKDAVRQRFLLTWHFPNAYSDVTRPAERLKKRISRRFEGHAYANRFDDAVAVAEHMVAGAARLERESRAFTETFYASTLPEDSLDAINAQLGTFVASSWLTRGGDFGIQEGLTSERSFGPMATVDVGMYGSIAAALLFPELDRAMWATHRRLQRKSGDIAHGVGRNFAKDDGDVEGVKSRLDLAPQYVAQTVRHFLYTDDREGLRDFWPSLRAALDYTLEKRDSDGDGLPEMAGSNSSYDNFPMFGPAAYTSSQFIAALDHAVAAAEALGEGEAAERYRAAAGRARAAFVDKLWNGEYFSLYNDEAGETKRRDEGCLTDQLIGQWANRIVGLPDVSDRKKIEGALRHIMGRNFISGDGLYNCRWPEDEWLHPVPESVWYDQANTFWSGVQFAFVSFLGYEGRGRDALRVLEAIAGQHIAEGRIWDHTEWGGHYYRSMSAWGIPHGLLGLSWNRGVMGLRPALKGAFRMFFAHPAGYGLVSRTGSGRSAELRIEPRAGACVLRGLRVEPGHAADKLGLRVDGGATPRHTVERESPRRFRVDFARPLRLAAGKALVLGGG